jgi:hypothetical protein
MASQRRGLYAKQIDAITTPKTTAVIESPVSASRVLKEMAPSGPANANDAKSKSSHIRAVIVATILGIRGDLTRIRSENPGFFCGIFRSNPGLLPLRGKDKSRIH